MKKPDFNSAEKSMELVARFVRARANRKLRGEFRSVDVAFSLIANQSVRVRVTGYRYDLASRTGLMAHIGHGKSLEEATDAMVAQITPMPDIELIIGLKD